VPWIIIIKIKIENTQTWRAPLAVCSFSFGNLPLFFVHISMSLGVGIKKNPQILVSGRLLA
jgi:hypothetical protein